MRPKQNMNKQIYNQFYRQHGQNVHLDPERFKLIASLCRGDVLDLGCGTGDLAKFYTSNYVGVDISDVAVEMARKQDLKHARFYEGDATQPLEMEGRPFDTIVMAEFLEHIKDDKIVFENVRKWSTNKTRLIISVPNGDRVPDKNHLRQFTMPQLRRRFSVLGRVRFYNWPGVPYRLIMSVDLGEDKRDLISLVMIVKDEQKGLERAILSTIDFVDNIAISVDSKSKDKTLEIARRYADQVKTFVWQDNFAKARNEAQEGITTKWILCIDGHEFVDKAENLDTMLEKDVDALMVPLLLENGKEFFNCRIYRSYCRWKFQVHNAIEIKSHAKYKEFLIKHDRQGGQAMTSLTERTKQRDEMMVRVLNENIKKNKKDARSLFYLARHYYNTQNWKKAIKWYKKYLKVSTFKGELWLACYEAAICSNARGKHLAALRFLYKAEKVMPNRWEISKQLGMTYALFRRWQKAIQFLVDSFKINRGDFIFNPEQRDDANTWDIIGVCFLQLKQYKKAIVAWEEALKNESDPDKIKLLKKRIELLNRGLIT